MKLAPVSTSVAEIEPVAVVVDASSVTAPVPSDPALGASLAPVMVIVIVCVVPPSALVTTNVSDRDADAARAFTVESELSRV